MWDGQLYKINKQSSKVGSGGRGGRLYYSIGDTSQVEEDFRRHALLEQQLSRLRSDTKPGLVPKKAGPSTSCSARPPFSSCHAEAHLFPSLKTTPSPSHSPLSPYPLSSGQLHADWGLSCSSALSCSPSALIRPLLCPLSRF